MIFYWLRFTSFYIIFYTNVITYSIGLIECNKLTELCDIFQLPVSDNYFANCHVLPFSIIFNFILNSTLSREFIVKLSLSSSLCHNHKLRLNTASTQDCLSPAISILSLIPYLICFITYNLSLMSLYTLISVTSYHPVIISLPINHIAVSIGSPTSLVASIPITFRLIIFKYTSNFP